MLPIWEFSFCFALVGTGLITFLKVFSILTLSGKFVYWVPLVLCEDLFFLLCHFDWGSGFYLVLCKF